MENDRLQHFETVSATERLGSLRLVFSKYLVKNIHIEKGESCECV